MRKEAKAHGLQRRIEGPPLEPQRSLRGRRGRGHDRRLDARGDRGAAARRAIEICGVVSVLDRLAGGGEAIEARRGRALRGADDDRRHLPRPPRPARPADAMAASRARRGRLSSARRGAEDVPAAARAVPRAGRVRAPRARAARRPRSSSSEALFGERPAAEALIAERGSEAVGYALFFPTFSSFLASEGVWLEDLFVRPAHRGAGVGQGAAGGGRRARARARRRAPGMGGARLERARARLLPGPRARSDGRVDHPPARRRGAERASPPRRPARPPAERR